jgi:probable F420-dependent oxidoreductase
MNTPSKSRPALGRVGIWSGELRFGEAGRRAEAAAELEELGYGTLWFPGGVGGDVTGDVDGLLAATKKATIGTGILNIWRHEPKDVGDWWRGVPEDKQARVMLGLGVSHQALIGADYGKPLTVMTRYLDGLDAAGVPAESRCLAALAPKMLDLSRDRSAGTHPYLSTPEHSRVARERVGPDAIVAPEQGVVLERDPAVAREMARKAVSFYTKLPNYVNNWLRLGFTQDDVDQISDRLIDGLFAWGGVDEIKARVDAHIDAGADHVCLQVIAPSGDEGWEYLRNAWRELAKALV